MGTEDGSIGGPLRGLARLRDVRSRRASSHDRSGGNEDFVWIKPGEAARLLDAEGAGCITHIWMTAACKERHYLRKLVLRMWWDGEETPSVEVPLGDFFGIGHAETRNFASLPLAMSPQAGRGLTCYFPMPFAKAARIEVENQCSETSARLYFYVDYESYTALADDMARFHATWHRENPCDGMSPQGMNFETYQYEGTNRTGEGNYVILEAEGSGHYVGCHLDIHNLTETKGRNWYGEGDDMIFVDGESLPSIHGTGTEDYFNTAWCPQEPFTSPYFGITMPGGPNWSGKISLYRYHVEDPIHFRKSIRVTIEHGHANRRCDDYASTAYWYQAEPHKKQRPLMPVAERLPREDPV
ncbi:MAG: DUF2961 domain-containing protein [Proteobacteria bacterium]|nr:DUF2961 domain-containing protein [Pseudomonadota bacterium]MBI3495864.1 DUF2961 domain-containing protein [Pseudomonadota bacterium]